MMKRTTTVIFCIVLLSGLVATAGNFRYVSGGRLAVDKRYDADVDPVLEKRLRSWQSRLEGQMNQVIGHCDRTLSVEHPEGSLNNLCTDMLLAQTREVIGLPADAALLNNRGIRRSLPQGDITVGNHEFDKGTQILAKTLKNARFKIVCSNYDLARQSTDVDVIVGGHSHTFLREPVVCQNKLGEDVVLSQMGCDGVYLGRIVLKVKKKR